MKYIKTLFKKLSILSIIGTILLVGTIIFASRFSSDLKGFFLEPDPTAAVKSIYIPSGYVVPNKTLTMPIKLKTDVALRKISFEVTYPNTVTASSAAINNSLFNGINSTSINPTTKRVLFTSEIPASESPLAANANPYEFATFTVTVGTAGTANFTIQNVQIFNDNSGQPGSDIGSQFEKIEGIFIVTPDGIAGNSTLEVKNTEGTAIIQLEATKTAAVTLTLKNADNQTLSTAVGSGATIGKTPETTDTICTIAGNTENADGTVTATLTGVGEGACVLVGTVGTKPTSTVTITITPSTVVCGNGTVDTGEQCDDGNTIDTDACKNDCTTPGGGGGEGAACTVNTDCTTGLICVNNKCEAEEIVTPSPTTLTVTVVGKTSVHPEFGNGSNLGYSVNGVEGDELNFIRGTEYSFILLTPGHPFYITQSTTGAADSTIQQITEGVAGVGNGKTSGVLKFTPTTNTPDILYYQCGVHEKMGWKINIINPEGGGEGDACTVDADCDEGFVCENNVCESEGGGEGDACTVDTDCDEGFVCENNVCEGEGGGEGDVCTVDADCDEGFTCENNVCESSETAVPKIVLVKPNIGGVSGISTSVRVSGFEPFTSTSLPTITFGGTAGTNITFIDSTVVRVTTPSKTAGSFDVVLTFAGKSATLTNGFTYTNTPAITEIIPEVGEIIGGSNIIIKTINMIPFTSTSSVTVNFGTSPGTSIIAVTDTEPYDPLTGSATSKTLKVSFPSHTSGKVNVVVTSGTETATITDGFTYDNGVPGDMNANGVVDAGDLDLLVFTFFEFGGLDSSTLFTGRLKISGDVNGDGKVDNGDAVMLKYAYFSFGGVTISDLKWIPQ